MPEKQKSQSTAHPQTIPAGSPVCERETERRQYAVARWVHISTVNNDVSVDQCGVVFGKILAAKQA